MKILEKIIIPLSIVNIIGALCVGLLPGFLQIALAISMIGSFGFFYVDGLDFCRKLERAAKGENVKF